MYYALVSFKTVPKPGFSHHFYAESYSYTREKLENSLEIVYIKKGNLTIEFEDETMLAEPGSIFVLIRTLPLTIKAEKGSMHTHCTVELISDFEFELVRDKTEIPPDYPGLVLPFVTPPCPETERMKKKLYSVVSELSVSGNTAGFTSSLCCMGILEEINSIYKSKSLNDTKDSSILCYKIRRYISEHLNESIHLSDISNHLGKTSVYLNSVFKKENGTTIHQYINREKIRIISELMENKGLPFKTACENAGITDVSYGYRMFKKHTGITPAHYKGSFRHVNKI